MQQFPDFQPELYGYPHRLYVTMTMLFQSVFQSLINAIFYVRHSPWFGHVGTSEVWRACLLTASRWRTLRWSRVVPGGRCGGSQDRQRMITEMSQVFTSWDCWLVWNFDTFTTHITHYLNLLEWYFSCERVKCQVVFHLCSSWGWWILNNRAPVGSNSASERTHRSTAQGVAAVSERFDMVWWLVRGMRRLNEVFF